MSDNGSVYIPPPDKRVQLAQPQTPPMQTRQQAAITSNDIIIPPTQLSNKNGNKSNKRNSNNNKNEEKEELVIPSNPRARKRLALKSKRKIKRGKRGISSDLSSEDNNNNNNNNIIDGSTSSGEQDDDIKVKTKNSNKSSDDTSNSAQEVITSFSAQLAELRGKYPKFKLNRLFEKFIYNRYSRTDVRAAQSDYKKTGKAFTMKKYDEYLAVRAAMEDILSDEQAKYFYELELNKQLNVYINLKDKLETAQEKLEEYAMEENPQHKQRKRLINDYDKARQAVIEKAKERPGNGDLSLARKWDKKSSDEVRRTIRSGYTIWMDRRGGRIPKPQHRNDNNHNYNTDESDTQLPKSKGKRKLISKQKEKKQSQEVLEDIRERFVSGKNLTVSQREYLLDKLLQIDENAKKFNENTGHKKAQEEKDKIEEFSTDDEDLPPRKRRKLDNGMDRMDEAERKSKEEVKYIFFMLYILSM